MQRVLASAGKFAVDRDQILHRGDFRRENDTASRQADLLGAPRRKKRGLHHRLRIQAAVGQYVEPQIAAMLEELTRSLDAPFDPNPFDADAGRGPELPEI